MDKHEKMNQIKEYISKIEEDLNTFVCSDRETITSKNILQCMKYISELLEETINESSGKTSQSGKRFFITEEQYLKLQIKDSLTVSKIADEINKVTVDNNTEKIQATWITDWLIEKGLLYDECGCRVATKDGEKMGIKKVSKTHNNRKYYFNIYSEKAQQFVYNNIKYIVDFYYNKSQCNYNFKIVSYPKNMPLYKFISENKKENIIIMSVGSCNTTLEKGNYKTLLIYQKAHKVLQENIITRSANRCILYGIKKATEAIKKPSDVMIISPTPLGFGKKKTANCDICHEIIDILTDKNCNIKIVTCEGMGFELRNYINLISKINKKSP